VVKKRKFSIRKKRLDFLPKKVYIMDKVYYTIGEVSQQVGVPTHTIRYWEQQIPELKPKKILNGIRHYRQEEINQLKNMRQLLYEQRLTIDGARQTLRQHKQEEHANEWIIQELKAIIQILDD